MVRVSVTHADDNSTLRCYAEGYYPDNVVTMFWYADQKTDIGVNDCQRGPLSDGKYRQVCKYTCHKKRIYNPICRVYLRSAVFVNMTLGRGFDVTDVPYMRIHAISAVVVSVTVIVICCVYGRTLINLLVSICQKWM